MTSDHDRLRANEWSAAQGSTSLHALTRPWSVPPWIHDCYERWANHPTVLLRAAALGLIYAHFLFPEEQGEREAYLRAKRSQPECLPSERAWKRAVQTSPECVSRLAIEVEAEIGSLRDMLVSLTEENECTAGERFALLLRREQLELALFPLMVTRSASQRRKELRELDAEAVRHLERATPISTMNPLMLAVGKRYPKRWWGRLIRSAITKPRSVV